MAVIFAMSSLSSKPDVLGGVGDYTGHFAGYTILAVLTMRGFARGTWRGVTGLAAVQAVVMSSLYGITDEFHQSFVPGRTSSVADWGVDTLAACVGAGIVMAAARVVLKNRADRGI